MKYSAEIKITKKYAIRSKFSNHVINQLSLFAKQIDIILQSKRFGKVLFQLPGSSSITVGKAWLETKDARSCSSASKRALEPSYKKKKERLRIRSSRSVPRIKTQYIPLRTTATDPSERATPSPRWAAVNIQSAALPASENTTYLTRKSASAAS